ncbi:DNA replication/repair protein RecF [Carnobacteriaceae bacterium zg-84]|uniref:DNA replication/repair protein RecF n=1 Tax=Granulicatella sp. zg-84 TaxID=2678503 RepID=UPI0013C148F6|nr:DNA replication/repair protein RecF [Granulicatella sp. zg-84]NEW66908.1 DNA replication/repair protein RecF [Granulicatella sp. zg-84]QMI85822.1 DNA replication/repair protein RecF [Carnobacteriaceae bacterium zg-84]
MKIENLSLVQYRNYTKQMISFSPNVNIFLGKNAQGKTNLMESIHVLALTKSHRTSQEKELIEWEHDFTRIEALIKKNEESIPLKLIIHKKGKKAVVGNIEKKKLSQYIGILNVVLFSPEDLNIIKGSPSIRRRFIDVELGQMNALYLYHLSQYQKILKQRNLYLKERQIDDTYLDVLTEQLCLQAASMLHARIQFIKKLEIWAMKINHLISQEQDCLSLVYESQIDYTAEDDENTLYEKYMTLFKKGKKREIDQCMTLFGPHRDDLVFMVNGVNVQVYGSQGQQRTVALSIKLAEIDLMKEMTGDYPILLLDDVLSELDDDRQTFLLKSIEHKVQTFITTTNIDGIKKNMISEPKIFEILKGSVVSHD